MIAPPWFELPPTAYGGIEAMASDLIEQLTLRGLDITLVGVGRNGTPADFVPTYDRPNEDRLGQVLPEHGERLLDDGDGLATASRAPSWHAAAPCRPFSPPTGP